MKKKTKRFLEDLLCGMTMAGLFGGLLWLGLFV